MYSLFLYIVLIVHTKDPVNKIKNEINIVDPLGFKITDNFINQNKWGDQKHFIKYKIFWPRLGQVKFLLLGSAIFGLGLENYS